jgi:hypothetical protein
LVVDVDSYYYDADVVVVFVAVAAANHGFPSQKKQHKI